MAGAGVALYLGTQAPATNPAAMVFLGKRYDIGIEVFNPNRQFSVTGSPSGFPGTFGLAPGTVESGSKLLPDPVPRRELEGGRERHLRLQRLRQRRDEHRLRRPRVRRRRRPASTCRRCSSRRPTPTSSAPRHAARGERHPRLPALRGQGPPGLRHASPATRPTSPTTTTRTPTARGVRVGYLGELTDWLSVGASYQSRINMSKFDEYSGLFAEKGGFDIPQTFTGGVAVKPADEAHRRPRRAVDQLREREVGGQRLPAQPGPRAARDATSGAGLRLARHDGLQGGPAVRGGPGLDPARRLLLRPSAHPRQRGAHQHPRPGRDGAPRHRGRHARHQEGPGHQLRDHPRHPEVGHRPEQPRGPEPASPSS